MNSLQKLHMARELKLAKGYRVTYAGSRRALKRMEGKILECGGDERDINRILWDAAMLSHLRKAPHGESLTGDGE